MVVLVRQISTGLYWKSGTGWVQAQDAEVFESSVVALAYCTENEMRDVNIILSFDDPQYDVVLHPFGEKGHVPTSRELVEQSRDLKQKSDAIKDASKEKLKEMKDLLAGVQQTVAGMKEKKKQVPFKRKKVS